MNLFVDVLSEYLINECADVLTSDATESNKITLVVQSLPLSETLAVLTKLDDYFVTQQPGTRRALKISRGLWMSWSDEEKAALTSAKSVERSWVDINDQLTTYRNEGHCVFFGFDHASDKGSLKDFHLVSEELLWARVLQRRFDGWVARIGEILDDNDSNASAALLDFLEAVHKNNARRLVRVSRFFEELLDLAPENMREFVSSCYAELPSWGGLPLLDMPIGRNLPRVRRLIELGQRFCNHSIFVSKAERDKVTKKLAKSQAEDPGFDLPQPVGGGKSPYGTADDYLEDVRIFVRDNDSEALARLRQSDASSLLMLLEKREKKTPTDPKATTLRGYSDVVFLQAIQLTLQKLIEKYRADLAAGQIEEIKIRVTHYHADGDDPYQEVQQLLNGIVGAVIPERLPGGGEGKADIAVVLEGLEDIVPRETRATARIGFTVSVTSTMDTEPFEQQFVWPVPATHPERLRLVLAEQTLRSLARLGAPRLPLFNIGGFDELFYAIDEDDAHRLLLLGMSDLDVKNAFDGLAIEYVSPELVSSCTALTSLYKEHLESILANGFHQANSAVYRVIDAYSATVAQVIGTHALGAEQILPRLYRAFLTVRSNDNPSQPYVDAALVLPISPFVLELCSARAVFLHDGFSEVIGELFESGSAAAQQRWQHLIELAELRRPIVALIADANKALTTWSRSFGLTHLVGSADNRYLPVASQSLMRKDVFDEDDLGQRLQSSANSRIYERLIRDYQVLHRHANDQLSLLLVNVSEIEVMLSGVDRWLKTYLTETVEQAAPFNLEVKVITTGVATTTALNILVAWKNAWAEGEFPKLRPCSIQIGHRHAKAVSDLESMLRMEPDQRFDIAVISHFLEGKHAGDQLEHVAPFDAVQGSVLRQFPIAEYPRPATMLSLQSLRKTVISNRRVQMASKHTEISARLRYPQAAPSQDHAVVTQVEFSAWRTTIKLLHQKALWVSCVDRHIDSNLIATVATGAGNGDRRVVGFSCGLGNYGELNQTISTEVSDLATLTKAIGKRLRQHLDQLTPDQAELAARNIIGTACEIPGLSLVRAAGHDEYIRDVIGYSLISRLFGQAPGAVLQVLIPLDSFRHWFRDREDPNIPDLLFMSASLVDERLQISATVIESKFGHENSVHSEKAFAQASAGLRQLVRIFAPHDAPLKSTVFERKYWWAQLHRALSSRAVVTLPSDAYQLLCSALERLAEGEFTIEWRAFASTFWTDKTNVDASPIFMGAVDVSLGRPLPNAFGVYQLQFGADRVISLLIDKHRSSFASPGTPLVLSARSAGVGGANDQLTMPKAARPVEPLQHTPATVVAKTSEQPEPANIQQSAPKAGIPVSQPLSDGIELPGLTPATSPTADVVPTVRPPVAEQLASAERDIPVEASPVSRLLLGSDSRGQDIFWEYGDPDLENRHLLIFGGSGSGKTYAIQCLLLEMTKQHQHTAIIDYTDGFLPSHLDPAFVRRAAPVTHVLVRQPFPINPFQRLTRDEPGIGELPEQPHNVASRVSDVFCSVYDVGDVQRAALAKQIELGLIKGGKFGLEELLEALEGDPTAPPTLALKIAELVKQKPFSNEQGSGWQQIFEGSSPSHILQLTNLSKEVQRLIAEFALWDFFAYATRFGSKDRPLPVVLDEMQNLDHRSDRAIEKLLREGRKFGVGMILATQTISNFNKEQRSRLFQCAQKLFFKPAETERREFAQILADVSPGRSRDDWIMELSKLSKGECWAIGPQRQSAGRPMRREPVKLRIAAMDTR